MTEGPQKHRENPYVDVRLYTESGGFVCEGEIPRFVKEPPRILLWGSRFFRYSNTISRPGPVLDQGQTGHGVGFAGGFQDVRIDYHVYVEAFTVSLVRTKQRSPYDERPADLDKPAPEPMIGGPHEVTNQYTSEPDRDPRQ